MSQTNAKQSTGKTGVVLRPNVKAWREQEWQPAMGLISDLLDKRQDRRFDCYRPRDAYVVEGDTSIHAPHKFIARRSAMLAELRANKVEREKLEAAVEAVLERRGVIARHSPSTALPMPGPDASELASQIVDAMGGNAWTDAERKFLNDMHWNAINGRGMTDKQAQWLDRLLAKTGTGKAARR